VYKHPIVDDSFLLVLSTPAPAVLKCSFYEREGWKRHWWPLLYVVMILSKHGTIVTTWLFCTTVCCVQPVRIFVLNGSMKFTFCFK